VARSKVEVLRKLPTEVQAMLYAEALRMAQDGAAAVAAFKKAVSNSLLEEVERFGRDGVDKTVLSELPLNVRAVLAFVRSRDASLSKDERALWQKVAKEDDVLHGVATRVQKAWQG
jgi:hypothetical protein